MSIYLPSSCSISLSGFPSKRPTSSSGKGSTDLIPVTFPGEPSPVLCFEVCGTTLLTYTCEESEESSCYSSTSYNPNPSVLRFHAHPSSIKIKSVSIASGSNKVLKVSEVVSEGTAISSSEEEKTKGWKKGRHGIGRKEGKNRPPIDTSPLDCLVTGLREVTLKDPLPTGLAALGQQCILSIVFTTLIRPATIHGMCGLYYTTAEGDSENYCVLSHFEVHHAKRAFPTIDDPLVRMKWQIEVTCKKNDGGSITEARSNGQSVISQDGCHVAFPVTHINIPAYTVGIFLAFGVSPSMGKMVSLKGITGRDETALPVLCNIVTSKATNASEKYRHLLQFVMKTTFEAIHLLEDLFGCEIPLLFGEFEGDQCQVLDVLFWPDIPVAGMEHHSLIFLNENLLKPINPKQSVEKTQEELAMLVVHELCHHWCGNLIGMPFINKEGICMVVEECLVDVIMGRAKRTFQTMCGEEKSTIVEGQELTGLSYQKALAEMRGVVARLGWGVFEKGLKRLVALYCNEGVGGKYVFEKDLMALLSSSVHE